VELRQLEHFVAVAEERSFTRAAHRANIVQSGLSMSIRALEEEVGTKLFERGARGIILTPAGEAMLPDARRAIAAVDSARVSVGASQGLLRGTLRVGIAQASDPHRVASLLGRFHDEHPGVVLRVVQGNGTTLLNAISDGTLDIAVCGRPIVLPDDVTTLALARGRFVMACATSHPLASRSTVKLSELVSERFIEMNRGWVSRQHTDYSFGLAGIRRNIVCELDDVVLLLQMVEEGLGIAIVAGTAGRPMGIRYVPIDPGMGEWQFIAGFLGETPPTPPARVFLGMVMREWLSVSPAVEQTTEIEASVAPTLAADVTSQETHARPPRHRAAL
jgi:DNA-binding transcriptional LysR family regulator